MATARKTKNNLSGGGIEQNTSRTAKNKRRRKRRFQIGLIVLVLLACAVFVVLSLTVLFRVSEFTVEDETGRYSEEEIINASEIQTGINLFSVDTAAAANRIETQLPYIEEARVSIRLPDRVQIGITMAEPIAQIETNGGAVYISKTGKVLGEAEKNSTYLRFKSAGIVSAQPGSTAEYDREDTQQVISAMVDALRQVPLSQVETINLSDLYGIVLYYGDLYEIRVGSIGDLKQKLEFARHIIENKLDPEQSGTLDLSAGADQAVFRPDYDSGGIIILPEKEETSSDVSSVASAS